MGAPMADIHVAVPSFHPGRLALEGLGAPTEWLFSTVNIAAYKVHFYQKANCHIPSRGINFALFAVRPDLNGAETHGRRERGERLSEGQN
jgi:hypothetical protein